MSLKEVACFQYFSMNAERGDYRFHLDGENHGPQEQMVRTVSVLLFLLSAGHHFISYLI